MQSGLFSAIQLILKKTFWFFKRPRMSFSPHCFYDKSKMRFLVSILVYFILCHHFRRWGLGKAIGKYNKKNGIGRCYVLLFRSLVTEWSSKCGMVDISSWKLALGNNLQNNSNDDNNNNNNNNNYNNNNHYKIKKRKV